MDESAGTRGPEAPLRVLDTGERFPEVRLIERSASGYLLLAARVDRRPPLLGSSRRKRRLTEAWKRFARDLRPRAGIVDCAVFRALLTPPGGGGDYLERRSEPVRRARFDLVLLVEADSPGRAEDVRDAAPYRELEAEARESARHVYATTATNVRRMGPVDHSRDGVFLFNFFVADRREQNLAVWRYTAGWFQERTGLDNSTLLLPTSPEASEYTLVNHCRWDRLLDVLPALVFERSFRTYVLAHFEANATVPMPVLYELA